MSERRRMMTVRGVTRAIQEWADISGISRPAIYQRIKRGWTPEEAVDRPKNFCPALRVVTDDARELMREHSRIGTTGEWAEALGCTRQNIEQCRRRDRIEFRYAVTGRVHRGRRAGEVSAERAERIEAIRAMLEGGKPPMPSPVELLATSIRNKPKAEGRSKAPEVSASENSLMTRRWT